MHTVVVYSTQSEYSAAVAFQHGLHGQKWPKPPTKLQPEMELQLEAAYTNAKVLRDWILDKGMDPQWFGVYWGKWKTLSSRVLRIDLIGSSAVHSSLLEYLFRECPLLTQKWPLPIQKDKENS